MRTQRCVFPVVRILREEPVAHPEVPPASEHGSCAADEPRLRIMRQWNRSERLLCDLSHNAGGEKSRHSKGLEGVEAQVGPPTAEERSGNLLQWLLRLGMEQGHEGSVRRPAHVELVGIGTRVPPKTLRLNQQAVLVGVVLRLQPDALESHFIVNAVVNNSLWAAYVLCVALHLGQDGPWVELAEPSLFRVLLAMAAEPVGECHIP